MVEIFPESSRVNDSLLNWGISLVLKRRICTAKSRVEFSDSPPCPNGEMADTPRLERGSERNGGSSPSLGTFFLIN
jgi:hypothetical protein